MAREIRGRRFLITGGSGGIGKALAELAGEQGARLALVARNQDRLEEFVGQLRSKGVEAHAVAADITSEDDRSRLLQEARAKLGGIDVLVNNAGIAAWGHFSTSDENVLRQIMEVNFFAPVELIRQAAPILERGREPVVVNVSSMCGRRGMPAWPEYSASKFALCGISEALRGEMCRYDIDLKLLVPGLTKTNLQKQMLRCEGKYEINYDKGMPAEKVAAALLSAIRSGGFETVVGSDAKWFLRLNRCFPRLLDWLIGRRIRRLYAE